MSGRAREKSNRQEKAFERRDRMLDNRRTEDRATVEEVFDQSTRMVLFKFLNNGVLNEVSGVISAGKEARVYWGKTKEGEERAVKIYLTSSAEFKKGMLMYIEGDYRFKNVRRDTRSLISTWAQKEFRNLDEANKAKVRVPKPIAVERNIVIMEFIGKDGVSAPRLKEQPPDDPAKTYKQLLTFMKRLYQKAELVHGDLSEYNLMTWKGKLVMFDMSQSVPTSHPLSEFLLKRDIENVNRFFSRQGLEVLPNEKIYKQVTENVNA
ncbi:MAG TPA: serine protein kinase RIO [Candidatus Nanoarchaeia archaeon]|nr:serine protein kinase RIO [Candidatus Nanoarchaeia archaeon]